MIVNEMVPKLKQHFESVKGSSAWKRGVNEYVLELLESLQENYGDKQVKNKYQLQELLLSGAPNWEDYSWGGCSLIYDSDIAERLCTPSQLKRYDDGRLDPSRDKQWLDIQKIALQRASHIIEKAWGLND